MMNLLGIATAIQVLSMIGVIVHVISLEFFNIEIFSITMPIALIVTISYLFFLCINR